MANYQSQYTGEQIDAAVQQAQRVPTLEQNIANGDAECILRMQGKSNNNIHDNTLDPFYFKQFDGGESATIEAMEYLDNLKSTESGVVPLGLLRLYINGSFVYVLQNVINYAYNMYTQTILNGNIVNGGLSSGINMYTRMIEYGETSWTPWRRFLTTDDV